MSKKIRILHVVTIMDVGGIETTIMNYMRHIDQNNFQFDFLVHRTSKGHFDDEIKSLGGNIFYAPAFSLKNTLKYTKFINRFFDEHNYDIVHSHLDSLSYFPLKGAMNNGVKVRIAHSHVNGFDKNITYPLRLLFKRMIPLSSTNYMACSQSAGVFMFGSRNFEIILNPIEIDKFRYNAQMRNRVRNELDVGSKILIGHVGRFSTAKNHKFILEIAKKLPSEKYEFLLIGSGELKNEIEELARENKIRNIEFIGLKDNIYDYLSAIDLFILPSLYEGLGIVAIEAQVSGLPTIISDNVSSNVIITDNVLSLPLDSSLWVENIELINAGNREVMNKKIEGYDIYSNASHLMKTYSNLMGVDK